MFLATFGQACEKTGWEVLAWTLMSNHYHLAIRTPKANLVAGMTWFQNAYTRRFNARHQQWGRLFGDRYKAIPVESTEDRGPTANRPADYLAVLLDYIHLNPVRARLIDPAREESILDYAWSSVSRAYAVSPKKRTMWMEVETGLALAKCRDTVAGRRQFVERLDRRAAAEEADRCGLTEPEIEERLKSGTSSLRTRLRRGWYWGSEAFREKLLERSGDAPRKNATYRSSGIGRDHAEATAESILEKAAEHFGLEHSDQLAELTGRGDWRRVATAWAIWKRTSSVSQSWIAKRLNLRSATNVSQRLRRFERLEPRKIARPVREWKKKMSEFFD